MRLIIGVVFMVLLLAGQAQAAFRCGDGLVGPGDRSWDVERLCGAPDLREPIEFTLTAGGTVTTTTERWYYNTGPTGLIRMLDLRDGRVTAIRSGGRGYEQFPGSVCDGRELQRGMTRMELLGRCGSPDARQVLSPAAQPLPNDGNPPQRVIAAREEWYYALSSGQLSRIVTLEGGRVTRVESGSRTP